MSSDRLKKLTGKNPRDFEPVAFDVINKPDIELFKELVDNDDFLFDFVKQNVAKRLVKNCNEKNYQKYTSIYCSHRYFVSDSNLVTTVCRRFLFHPQRLHATDDRTGRFYYGK